MLDIFENKQTKHFLKKNTPLAPGALCTHAQKKKKAPIHQTAKKWPFFYFFICIQRDHSPQPHSAVFVTPPCSSTERTQPLAHLLHAVERGRKRGSLTPTHTHQTLAPRRVHVYISSSSRTTRCESDTVTSGARTQAHVLARVGKKKKEKNDEDGWGGGEALTVRSSAITPPVARDVSNGRNRMLSPPSKLQSAHHTNHHHYHHHHRHHICCATHPSCTFLFHSPL